jgi:hypothetical protein
MMPRLGQQYEVEIETISKPIAEYQTDEYFELDLPTAPAVMVGEEIVAEGADVAEDKLEAVICQHLGLPAPEPQKPGFLGRIFGK